MVFQFEEGQGPEKLHVPCPPHNGGWGFFYIYKRVWEKGKKNKTLRKEKETMIFFGKFEAPPPDCKNFSENRGKGLLKSFIAKKKAKYGLSRLF